MNKSGVVNYYYYYPGYFSDAACEKISNSVKTDNVAKVDGNQIPKDHVRKTQVGFTSENFIYDLISNLKNSNLLSDKKLLIKFGIGGGAISQDLLYFLNCSSPIFFFVSSLLIQVKEP